MIMSLLRGRLAGSSSPTQLASPSHGTSMNLKKLSDLEAIVLQEGSIPPHEEDDPTMITGTTSNVYPNRYVNQTGNVGIGAATASGIVLTPHPPSNIIAGAVPGGWAKWPTQSAQSTVIEHSDPSVGMSDDDVIVTMNGGREMIFHTGGKPIHINGEARSFRLTKDQARALAVKLVKVAASEE